jgi:hypothetical protein
MKAREVVLAILIILAGILVTEVKTGRIVLDWDGSGYVLGRGQEFVFEETQEIAAPLPLELQVLNAHGTVAVEGAETDKITIHFTKRVYRKTMEEAREIADRIKLLVNRSDPRLILSTNRDEFRRRPFETDFKVTVPSGLAALIRNSYGLVRAGGTGRTDILNRHGEVIASALLGALVLENSYESVEIDGVAGEARLNCPHADVVARNIQGDFIIDHSYGRLRIEDLSGRLTVNGSHSDVFAKNLGGDAEIRSSYEAVIVSRSRAVTIRGHHCEIDVQGTTGLCDITNEYGAVRVGDLRGNLKIDARKAEIIGRLIRADDIAVATTYEKIYLTGFTGRTTVKISHAPLLLEPEAVTGPIDVQGSYADVTLLWPAGARHPFEAETRQGAIHWGLADRPAVETSNGTSVTKAFLEETGRPAVKITTSYGDIRVESSPRRSF